MVAILGTLPATILIRIGDGEPVEIGTAELSINATALTDGKIGVSLNVRDALADALRSAASEVEKPDRRSEDGHMPPAGGSGVSRPTIPHRHIDDGSGRRGRPAYCGCQGCTL